MSRSGAARGAFGARARALAAAGLGAGLAAGLGGALVACSSGAVAVTAGNSCGRTRTAAGVTVVIKVVRGSVDCAAALRAEQAYATQIRKGGIRGNGGGAPVTLAGWTCRGYPTPRVLRTGFASECHTASAEVVAVLAVPPVGI